MLLPPVPENLENIVVVREYLNKLRLAIEEGEGSGGGGGGGGTDKYAADRIVDPSGLTGTDTTLASALAALPANGGTIYVKAGTYNISTTMTLPLKNVKIIGAGGNVTGPGINLDATIFDLGSNAIALFTTPLGGGGTVFASYYFSDFKVIGNSSAAQQFLRAPVLALGSAVIGERLHIEGVQDIVKTAGQDLDVTFRDSTLNPKTATASFWNGTGSQGELTWDHVQADLPVSGSSNAISGSPNWHVAYSYLGGGGSASVFAVQEVEWTDFFLGKDNDLIDIVIGGSVSLITSCTFQGCSLHIMAQSLKLSNSWFSLGATPTTAQLRILGVGGVAKANITGCEFSGSGGSSNRGIDIVSVTDVTIAGCAFFGHTSEGIRATGTSTLSVIGCRFTETVPMNETATTVTGRYSDNTGFDKSIIIGVASSIGDDGSIFIAENKDGVTIKKGQPVSVHSSGTGVVRAIATSMAGAAIGVAYEDIAVGEKKQILVDGKLYLANWTDATGSASLTAEATYFVDTTAAKISTTAPSSIGEVNQIVGKSASPNILVVKILDAILL